MRRFSYQTGTYEVRDAPVVDSNDEPSGYTEFVVIDGFLIFDSRTGQEDEKAIAFTENRDAAEMIVAALNLAHAEAPTLAKGVLD